MAVFAFDFVFLAGFLFIVVGLVVTCQY